jgi:hypothetical protein
MDDTRWDHGLIVAGDGQGLVGHAGQVLLRKLADRAGLTGSLGRRWRKGKFPPFGWTLTSPMGADLPGCRSHTMPLRRRALRFT